MNDVIPKDTYTSVAITLHWLIGIAIILMLGFGFFMEDMPSDMKPLIYQTHKSIGLTILVLSFVRLFWRLSHKVPSLPQGMKKWEIIASKITHTGFYILMIGIPLSGWALVSSAPAPYDYPVQWFGLFEFPSLPLTRAPQTAGTFSEIHEILAYLTLALLALHIGAALKHHFINKDTVLTRMIPCLKNSPQ
jgi:cytochrome b561